jgi:hypothetical protein
MIIELLITLTSGLLLATVMLVLGRIIQDRWAFKRFQKLSRGMPVCPEYNLLGNHTRTLVIAERTCMKTKMYHEKYGKTFFGFMNTKAVASTVDLDLIKRIVIDEPNQHLNRVSLNIPAVEFEKTIMCAPYEEWRGLRKVIAPALT